MVEVYEAPASHLRAIAQVEILGERIGMPPPCVLQTRSPPHACGTVEVEEAVAVVPSTLLEEEVSVQKKRLCLREPGLVAIQVVPPGLHHAHSRVAERRQEVAQKVWRCDEVGIEDEEIFALRHRRPLGKGPRFEAVSVFARDVHHIDAAGSPMRDPLTHDLPRRVVGVVEHLHLEQPRGIVDQAHGIDEPADDMSFVIDRELHGYVRELLLRPWRDVFGPTPTRQEEQERPVERERDQKRQNPQREDHDEQRDCI